jgi:glycosyltransferase involved in cell wall biosynthesis
MISIVIPAFNEEDAITDTVKRCKDILQQIGDENDEVIVVDDKSKDDTAKIAEKAGARVIRHPHNLGYGKSLKDGITAAKNDTIFITDADGTYPIEEIPKLYEIYKEGFDMVVGARQGKHYDESFMKKVYRRILKFMVEYTAGRKIEDINSGLRCFSRNTILNYFDTLCDTFSFTTSLTLAYMMTSKFVTYTPIPYHKRVGKTKVKLLRDSLRTTQFIVEAILYYNPMKIFILFILLLLIAAGFSFGIGALTHLKVFYFLAMGSILISIIMFGLGLLSIQFKQILTVNKNLIKKN